jgi:hypothetical protein
MQASLTIRCCPAQLTCALARSALARPPATNCIRPIDYGDDGCDGVRRSAQAMEMKVYASRRISGLAGGRRTHQQRSAFAAGCPPPDPQQASRLCSDPDYTQLLRFVGIDVVSHRESLCRLRAWRAPDARHLLRVAHITPVAERTCGCAAAAAGDHGNTGPSSDATRDGSCRPPLIPPGR